MTARKPRILLVGEFTGLATGYSTYGREVLTRLHATGKYDLAELASYGGPADPRRLHVPWRYFPNLPDERDPAALEEYRASKLHEFGQWRLEETCLAFRPDVVWSFRDWWMDSFIEDSPYRRLFHFAHMPTVDAEPLDDQWLATYQRADALFAYTDWGAGVLRRYGLPARGSAPPGADTDTFRPMPDRARMRQAMGLPPDALVVGCFAKDTPVLMSDFTLKPIQDVRAGDRVLTHASRSRAVTAAHSFPGDKPMVAVSVLGEPDSITCTADHEVLAIRRDDVLAYVTARGQRVFHNPVGPNYDRKHDPKWTPGWVAAGELSTGDFMAFKIPAEVEDRDTVELGGEAVEVGADFLFLAGLYLAEGHIATAADCPNHSVCWTINRSDSNTIQAVMEAASAVFGKQPTTTDRPESNTVVLSVHKASKARVWAELFGTGASEKRLPSWFAALPPEKQLVVVRGWQAGDGCENGNRNIGVSVNLGLIHWMRVALLRNGIVASVNKRNMAAGGLYANAKQQWRLVEKTGGRRHQQFIHNGWLFSAIRSVAEAAEHDRVYDLTVEEDHSYAVYCKSVHNTVMRNQKRKLFPDLVDAFARFLAEAPADLSRRAYLYLHTGYPDLGWNIPRLLKEYGVGGRTLFTYACGACGKAYPDFYRDARAVCRNCKATEARLSDSNRGVGRDVLAKTYNMFDVFVQYSVCEGFGMPQVEAAACGVPVAAVDYSAMSDVVRKLGGHPVKVQRFFREADTHRLMAMPDNGDLVAFLIDFLSQPEPVRRRAGFLARQGVLEHYTYDRTARVWADHFDSVPLRPAAETWASPPRLHAPARDLPANLPDEAFVRWAVANVAGRPDLADGYMGLRMARELAWGTTNGGMGGLAFNEMSALGVEAETRPRPFTRDDVVNQLLAVAERSNHWERRRAEEVK